MGNDERIPKPESHPARYPDRATRAIIRLLLERAHSDSG